MAFQNVNEQNFVSLTKLAVGESLMGYAVDVKPSQKYEGKYNLIMKIDGKDAVVAAVGNLHYIVGDRKITLGLMTKITRQADKKITGGNKSTQYTVEQDPDSRLEGTFTPTANLSANRAVQQAAATEANSTALAGKIASLKG